MKDWESVGSWAKYGYLQLILWCQISQIFIRNHVSTYSCHETHTLTHMDTD